MNTMPANNQKNSPYGYRPTRDLTLTELNLLMKTLFGWRMFSERFYEMLPEEMREHFVITFKDEKSNKGEADG